MQNHHVVLGLGSSASEPEIRARYLELVREFPPERAPEKAAEIRAAYDALRDPIERLKNQLFPRTSSVTFEQLVQQQKPSLAKKRLPTKVLLSLGSP